LTDIDQDIMATIVMYPDRIPLTDVDEGDCRVGQDGREEKQDQNQAE